MPRGCGDLVNRGVSGGSGVLGGSSVLGGWGVPVGGLCGLGVLVDGSAVRGGCGVAVATEEFVATGVEVVVDTGRDVSVGKGEVVLVGVGNGVPVEVGRIISVDAAGVSVWLTGLANPGWLTLNIGLLRARSSETASCSRPGSSGLKRTAPATSAL